MWQVQESKKVLDHPMLTIFEELLKLPNGQTITWLRYKDEGNVATILARNTEGRFLLTREYNYPQQLTLIDLPGGLVDDSEDLAEGANRELTEEGGYRASQMTLLGSYYYNRRRTNSKQYVYLATDLQPESAEQDISEEIEVFWATEAEIDQLIRENQIQSPRLLSAWALYKIKVQD